MARLLDKAICYTEDCGSREVVTQYGTKYVVQMEVVGANGTRGLVEIVWQQDVGSTIFRLITAIPKPYAGPF